MSVSQAGDEIKERLASVIGTEVARGMVSGERDASLSRRAWRRVVLR